MILNNLLKALIFTILIESLCSLFFIKNKNDFINVILVQIVTNPLLNVGCLYFNFYVSLNARNNFEYIFEIINILIEGFIYSKIIKDSKISSYLLSVILNIISYVSGLLLIKYNLF